MRRSKLPSLNHHELVVAKHQRAGRPKTIEFAPKLGEKKKGVAKDLEPIAATRDFYLAAANARTQKKAQEFLKRYPFFTVYDDAMRGPRLATARDIEHFGKIARAVIGNMQRRGNFRKKAEEYKTKYMPASIPLVDDDTEFMNRELAHCHPAITASPYTSHQPTPREVKDFEQRMQSIKEQFENQKASLGGIIVADKAKIATAKAEWARLERKEKGTMEKAVNDYVSPYVFSYGGPRRSGGSFYRAAMRCETSMAACCYYLLQDVAKEEEVRICPQCDRLFIAKTKKQAYCGDKDCAKVVARAKSRRSYEKTNERKP
jgi:hypothetical protein